MILVGVNGDLSMGRGSKIPWPFFFLTSGGAFHTMYSLANRVGLIDNLEGATNQWFTRR